MPLIRTTTAGEQVRLFVLPPSDDPQLTRCWRKFCRSDDILGLDVETTAIDETQSVFDPDLKLHTVQFGSPTEGWMLNPSDPAWHERIRELLADTSKRFVSHTNYDVLWVLREFGIDLCQERRSIDTFVMAALLRPGPRRPKDLKTLSTAFIDSQLHDAEVALLARFKELAPKGQRVGRKLKAWGFTNIALDDPVFGRYGGLDAVYVRRLLPLLDKQLRAANMAPLSRREQQVQRLMTRVCARGMLLDQEYTTRRFEEVDRAWRTADRELRETLGFSPASPRVGPWLEGHGAVIRQRTKTGRPALTRTTLPGLCANTDPDSAAGKVLRNLITLADSKNLRTNLAICLLAAAKDGGVVHPKILTQQAVTGRMSIQKPAMQTFKKGPLRGCWIARPGKVLLHADYDSQEIVLAAEFSQDPAYKRIVSGGLNQHELTAELIFGEAFVSKTESSWEYSAAKVLDFAQQYGAGAATIAAQLGIPLTRAHQLWTDWNRAYAGLVRWTRHMAQFDEVVNPWGRVIPSDPWRRYANGNYVIQSSGRDLLGDSLIELDERGYGDAIWLPVHDEIILEVPEDDADTALKELEAAMFAEVGGTTVTASGKILGHRWSGDDDMKGSL